MFVPKWGFSGSGNLTASSRLSHFSATVAVFGDKLSQFSATVWTGFYGVLLTSMLAYTASVGDRRLSPCFDDERRASR